MAHKGDVFRGARSESLDQGLMGRDRTAAPRLTVGTWETAGGRRLEGVGSWQSECEGGARMFGWFRKTGSKEQRLSFERHAQAALAHIAGQISGHHYCLSAGRINFTDPAERREVAEKFTIAWGQLSKNRENWPEQIDTILAATTGASKFDQAAALLLVGILKTDMLCRVALEFPDDGYITGLASKVLSANMAAFDLVIAGPTPAAFGDPTPSTELLPELQYANAFFEKIAGLR